MKMLHLILLFLFLGFFYRFRTVDIDGKRIKLQLLNTTAQNSLMTMINEYWWYNGANVSWGVVKFIILKLFI